MADFYLRAETFRKRLPSYVSCIFLILFLTAGKITEAQVSSYAFSSSTGTYTSITGTLLYSGTWDDSLANVALPFTFQYNYISYNQVYISTNGFVSFNPIPSATIYCGLQASPLVSIAAYGTNLQGDSATSNIRYATLGSAPNRQFVIQWANCDHYTSTGIHGSNHWYFQLILNETSNAIQVVWGPTTDSRPMGANNCANTTVESGDVGLLGFSTSDFNIRSVKTGTNTWATSSAATALNAVCNMSSSNLPANGLTYTWTPPAPTAMVYDSSTTSFLNDHTGVTRSTTGEQIMQVAITTSGSLTPLQLTALNLSTAGCSNAATDLTNAKVYFTGYTDAFSSTTQFGSTFLNPNGNYTVNGSATLYNGTNYFWITYDISAAAGFDDTLSACCTSLVGNGTMGTQIPLISCPAGLQVVENIGHWTIVTHPAPHNNGQTILLLSDGTALVHSKSGGNLGYGTIFDRLTPDTMGNYVNGTWTSIAPMITERITFSSAVLKDGRVYCAGGEYGADGTQAGWHGEVFNPLTNTWSAVSGATSANIMSDGNCKILDDGRVLQALVPAPYPTSTVIFDPITMAYTPGPSTLGGTNESMWLKLPDKSILFVNEGAQTSERYIPATNSWIADGNVPVALYDQWGLECGPAFMLPDGRAFFLGSTGKTAFYTPSGTTAPGTWVAGPDIPADRGMPDAPGAMMINGKIVFACSAKPTAAVVFTVPAYFYEFDPATDCYTQINAPGGGFSVPGWSQNCALLAMPDGNILYANDQATSNRYYLYTPGGAPLAIGKPVIADITQLTCSTYIVTGIKFNGISEGAAFGDEGENDSNYPLVRIRATTGRIYYARSFNWNHTGVQSGTEADTVYFTLPAGFPSASATYSLAVVANGNPSDSVTFINCIPAGIEDLTAVQNTISVYPNPSTGNFTVYTSEVGAKVVELYNMVGERMYTATFNSEYKIINSANLSPGIYFVRLTVENGTVYNSKLIKE